MPSLARSQESHRFARLSLQRARRSAQQKGFERDSTPVAIFGISGKKRARNTRDVESISDVFGKFLEAPTVARHLLLPEIISLWPQIVGEAVAQHSAPETLSPDGRLTVRASSSSWATSLSLLGHDLVGRIHEVTKSTKVIEIHIEGPQPKLQPLGPRRIKGSIGYRDTFG